MNSETIWLVINTLETVEIKATEHNLSKMLAANQVLRDAAKKAEKAEKGGEANG